MVGYGDEVRQGIPTEKGLYGVTYGWGSYLQLTNLETGERIEFIDENGNQVSYESVSEVKNINDHLYGIAFLTDQYDGTVTVNGDEDQGESYNTTGILFQANIDETGFQVIGDKVYDKIQYINRNGRDLLVVSESKIVDGIPRMTNILWVFDITDPNNITSAKKEFQDEKGEEIWVDEFAVAKEKMLIYTHGNRDGQLMNIPIDDKFFTTNDQIITGGTMVKSVEDHGFKSSIIGNYEQNVFYVRESKSKTENKMYEIFNTTEYWPLMDEYHNVGFPSIFEREDGSVEVWVQDRDTKEIKKIYNTLNGKVAW